MMGGRQTRGFTLVEILVVMAIISTLAGLILGSVTMARRYADKKATMQEIQILMQAINNYNIQYGDYPPSSFSLMNVKVSNTTNEGNEALVLSLSGRKKTEPMEFKENRLENYDKDSLPKKSFQTLKAQLDFPQTKSDLFEYVDLWGNPFVYIHNRDYKKKSKTQYTDRGYKRVTVQAAKSAKLGMYHAPNGFQIWSFGPNGKNENGGGDDIASWK